MWLVGGFLLCPCHRPVTLWLLATLLAGTAAGALLREHVVLAAVVSTAAWALATWHGLRLLRAGRASADRVRSAAAAVAGSAPRSAYSSPASNSDSANSANDGATSVTSAVS